jgi:sodium/proline symporter
MSLILVGFIVYLAVVLLIGFLTYSKNKSHGDFILGGRRTSAWVIALAERSSGESAWLILGLPGLAYASGLIGMWDALGCVIGIFLYWYLIATKLRRTSEMNESITLPGYFAQHFTSLQKNLRLTATIIIIFFFTFYLAAQFNGAGKVLFVTFGIPQEYGILIGTVIIVIYTMMGGFLAVVWTDMVQGILMFGALVILPLVGFVDIMEQHKSLHSAIAEAGINHADITGGKTGLAAFAVILNGLSWGLGYMGQPHLLTKFMAIDKVENIKISRRIAFIWAVPAFSGAMMIGLLGLVYFKQGAFADTEYIMPQLATRLLPGWIAGIMISAAIAAMMSTADSQLLAISSSVIEDIYHKFLDKDTVNEKLLLRLSRIITIAVGVLAFVISITSKKLVFAMVSYAWAGLGAAFGPAMLLTLWWKKTTAKGVLAGMIVGTVVTVVWTSIPELESVVSSRFTAWLSAFFVIVIISHFKAKD